MVLAREATHGRVVHDSNAAALAMGNSRGSRITDMTILKTGELVDPAKTYNVAGWASVNEGTEGPAIWDVAESWIKKQGSVSIDPNTSVKVTGA